MNCCHQSLHCFLLGEASDTSPYHLQENIKLTCSCHAACTDSWFGPTTIPEELLHPGNECGDQRSFPKGCSWIVSRTSSIEVMRQERPLRSQWPPHMAAPHSSAQRMQILRCYMPLAMWTDRKELRPTMCHIAWCLQPVIHTLSTWQQHRELNLLRTHTRPCWSYFEVKGASENPFLQITSFWTMCSAGNCSQSTLIDPVRREILLSPKGSILFQLNCFSFVVWVYPWASPAQVDQTTEGSVARTYPLCVCFFFLDHKRLSSHVLEHALLNCTWTAANVFSGLNWPKVFPMVHFSICASHPSEVTS